MIHLFYNLLLLILLPFILPYFIYRVAIGKESANSLREKMGFIKSPPPSGGGIWVHAVSVGETNVSIPLIDTLLREYKDKTITFSASTSTGMGLALSKLKRQVDENPGRLNIIHFPYDFPFAVKASLRHIDPSTFIFFETEIWPNFLHQCRNRGVATVLVNGRISDRSMTRYMKARIFIAPYISSITLLLMQSQKDLEKIVKLGARPETVKVCGNMKFDQSLQKVHSRDEIRREFQIPLDVPVIIYSSTHSGEDRPLLEAFLRLREKINALFAIIAPRHPNRADEISDICKTVGIYPARRSNREKPDTLLLLDTIGELGNLYGATDIAVIGGSFIPHGGQNPLEASSWKIPVLFGPHMDNFRTITPQLIDAGAAFETADIKELETEIERLLKDEPERRRAGLAGFETILNNRGALKNSFIEISRLIRLKESAER